MPGQVFHVLQCYSCRTFQVQQKKKVNKWTCRMCGDRQSIKKVYGEGSGADCRRHVQEMNTLRGQMEDARTTNNLTPVEASLSGRYNDTEEPPLQEQHITSGTDQSRWTQYVQDNDASDEVEEHMSDDDALWTTNTTLYRDSVKQHRKRKKLQAHPYENRRQKGGTLNQESLSRHVTDDGHHTRERSPRIQVPNLVDSFGYEMHEDQSVSRDSRCDPPVAMGSRCDPQQVEKPRCDVQDYNIRKKQINLITTFKKESKWAAFVHDDADNDEDDDDADDHEEDDTNAMYGTGSSSGYFCRRSPFLSEAEQNGDKNICGETRSIRKDSETSQFQDKLDTGSAHAVTVETLTGHRCDKANDKAVNTTSASRYHTPDAMSVALGNKNNADQKEIFSLGDVDDMDLELNF